MIGEYKIFIFILFALVSAIAEAILYHKLYNPHSRNLTQSPEGKAADHWARLWEGSNWFVDYVTNEHTWYMAMRGLVWAVLFCPDWMLWHGVFAILSFPFFHDGMLYTFRNWLNPLVYRRGWWSEPSGQGTAMWDLSVGGRVTFFGLAIMMYVVFWVIG